MITPDEINQRDFTSDETSRSRKGMPKESPSIRFRNFIFSLMLIVYIFTTLAFGYWYMSRPVRKDQIDRAYGWWSAIATVYHIPVPKDERWGG
jgi:hypothetical protein